MHENGSLCVADHGFSPSCGFLTGVTLQNLIVNQFRDIGTFPPISYERARSDVSSLDGYSERRSAMNRVAMIDRNVAPRALY